MGQAGTGVDESTDTAAPESLTVPLLVLAGGILATVVAFLGAGVVGGTPVAEAAGGWLGQDATPVAPATPAFRIWSVIYLGLLAYSVWQLLPAQRRSSRQRTLRPWAAASMVLNAAWIWSVQLDQLTLSLVVIVVLLGVLVRMLLLTLEAPAESRLGAVVADGTFGLYLGWVTVATVANVAAVLAANGLEGLGPPAGRWDDVAAAVVLAAAAGVGVVTAWRSGGRLAPAVGLGWGLTWIGVGRLGGDWASAITATAAFLAAVVVLVAAVMVRPAGPVPSRDGLPS